MIYEFVFPDVGEGIHEGKILELLFNPGARVDVGDILAVVETDKVVAEIPAPRAGILQKYGADVDAIIKVGETLAFLQVEGAGPTSAEKVPGRAIGVGMAAPVENESGRAMSAGKATPGKEKKDKTLPVGKGAASVEVETGDAGTSDTVEVTVAAAIVGELSESDSEILPPSTEGMSQAPETKKPHTKLKPKATPVARKLAQEHGIDLATVKGSGPGGRIQKSDVMRFSQSEIALSTVKTGTQYNVPLTDDPLATPMKSPPGRLLSSPCCENPLPTTWN